MRYHADFGSLRLNNAVISRSLLKKFDNVLSRFDTIHEYDGHGFYMYIRLQLVPCLRTASRGKNL